MTSGRTTENTRCSVAPRREVVAVAVMPAPPTG